MALIFGDEVTTSYIKFNAKDQIWSVNVASGDVTEISPPRMVIDFDNLQTGWFRFRESQAPDIVLDTAAGAGTEPEGGQHKRGFRCEVFSPDLGVREFASCSLMLKKAMTAIYGAYEKDKQNHPGAVAIVEVTDHVEVTGKYGQNYKPVFAITGWVARPTELGGTAQVTTVETVAPTPAVVAPINAPLTDDLNDSVPF